VAFCDADARALDVGAAFTVDVAEAVAVEAGEEALADCRAEAAGEALAVPVCVLVDVGGV
jgi:hypothetical protein